MAVMVEKQVKKLKTWGKQRAKIWWKAGKCSNTLGLLSLFSTLCNMLLACVSWWKMAAFMQVKGRSTSKTRKTKRSRRRDEEKDSGERKRRWSLKAGVRSKATAWEEEEEEESNMRRREGRGKAG